MKNKSILLKSFVCGLVYLFFSLLLIFMVYILDAFVFAIFLGLLCGAIIVYIAYSNNIKKTILAGIAGLFSALISQFVLTLSGVPYRMMLYLLKDIEFVRETGRLTVNEVVGYGFGVMFFWLGLLISFIISIIIVSVVRIITKE